MEGAFEEKGANVTLDLRNLARAGPVNEGCGAELVQKGQVPPCGVSNETDQDKMLCSFDGDADRIVFHVFPSGRDWYLLDGDRIACLFSAFLKEELQAAGILQEFRFGCVQTAYANGGSTDYLRALGVPVVMAKTGVKYLHHAALEAFDVGVYFEANGHGTVLFSPRYLTHLRESAAFSSEDPRKALAMRRLRAFTEVINQAVGDAISDLLASLACLRAAGLDLSGWKALYDELPSRQLKCPSEKKALIQCCPDETRTVAPDSLQPLLDAAMNKYPHGRCFVRPSGTEDVVRVYAEAETQANADSLADDCVKIITSSLG
jgi:phosphoacetylglucosamine mutase